MKLPQKATVETWTPSDGVGTLRLEDGTVIRFGASACVGFEPDVGLACFLVETRPDPIRGGERAKVVNTTGAAEMDRLAAAQALNERAARAQEIFRTILADVGLSVDWRPSDLVALTAQQRGELAKAVSAHKDDLGTWDELLEALSDVDPSSLHPYLASFSPDSLLECRAFTRAPWPSVAPLVEHLAPAWRSTTSPLEVGEVITVGEVMARRAMVGDPTAGAALALARSRQPEALRSLEAWLETLDDDGVEEALSLLLEANLTQRSSGELVPLDPYPAFRIIEPTTWVGESDGVMWDPLPEPACSTCDGPLHALLDVWAESITSVVGEHLIVPVCLACAANGAYVVGHVIAETIESVESVDAWPEAVAVEAPHRRRVAVVADPHPVGRLEVGGHAHDRIGGPPTWIQDPVEVECQRCEEPMRFVAQVEDTEVGVTDAGFFYVFHCPDCGVVVTFTQGH